jgi:hypothetical protein
MAQQSIVGSNTGLETAPSATWRPSISLVYPMINEEREHQACATFFFLPLFLRLSGDSPSRIR